MRWHKKEIERGYAAKRGQDSGASPQLDRHQYHGQQKQHGSIGQIEMVMQRHCQQGRDANR